MGKNNNAAVWKQLEEQGLANVQSVDIETSAEDGVSRYVPTYTGSDKYARVGDEQYNPTIKVTIHGKDRSVRKYKIKSLFSFWKQPEKARQLANAGAQEMWREARKKGIPVSMYTGRNKHIQPETKNAAHLQWEHQMQQKAIEDAHIESMRGKIATAVVGLVMTVILVGGCVGLVLIAQWLGM